MTGTLERCLRDFSLRHNLITRLKSDFTKRKKLADFFGVGDPAVYGWFKGNCIPVGIQLIKLQHFLEFIGYDILETHVFSEEIKMAGRIIFLNKYSQQDFKNLANNIIQISSDNLYQVFQSKRGMCPERQERLRNFVHSQKENLANLEIERKIELSEFFLTHRSSPAESRNESFVENSSGSSGDVDISTLSHLLLASLPLAEKLVNFGTEKQRNLLREQTKVQGGRSNAIFELSNILNRLCSERARREM